MTRIWQSTALMAALLLVGGCSGECKARRGRIMTQQLFITGIPWTPQELGKEIAVRSYRVTRSASYHFILLNGAEKPHVHDSHDLLVTVISGQVRMNLGLQSQVLGPGDVVDIPRGVLHWAQNLAATGSEAVVVFTPPYDGTDMRLVDVPGGARR